MAKKNVEMNNVPTKSIDEMTDIEFITSADYLASPYYRAYVSAKARVASEAFQPLTRSYDMPAPPKAKSNMQAPIYGKKVRGAVYSKKRAVAQVFITILMLLVLAITVVGFLDIAAIDSYIATYVKPGATEEANLNIDLLDPVFGIVKKLAKADVDSYYYDSYISNMSDQTDIMTKISLYAVPVAALLIIVCALVGFFKGIVALCSKKYPNGLYKKYKFGFLSIVMLLSALILLVGGIFASGLEIKVILDFILGKTAALSAGYGLYALVILPIITLILSCASYKKAK